MKRVKKNKVGFVGLGIMGKPMVYNLIKNNYEVFFYARKRKIISEVSSIGAEFVPSIEDIPKYTSICITNLPNTKDVKRSLIQFHFCVKGGADFIFNNGNYLLPIDQNKVILLFNPEKDLPINLKLNPKSSILSIIISIKKFHSLFSSDAENIPFLSDENTAKKYYETMVINPSMNFVINQITKAKVNNKHINSVNLRIHYLKINT